ncbi:energy transducer TonB [Pelagicoccus mobilis]|uniref:Energy transducer TonB n=1 Tax=Pelagicoccus mobilis TaxID=415221 RepID=A0A934RUF1_9BACT|nr:energy transducer TonB [Pelagicoccus mobilis]MBK1876613.1 energy transducer TonB [Pelagicoccus mobilis]
MNEVYAPASPRAENHLKALALGTACVVAVFSILPILSTLPGLLTPEPPPTPITTHDNPPQTIEFEKTPPPPPEPEIEKPVIEEPPPPMTIDQLALIINATDGGVKVAVDAGKSFLDKGATAITHFLPSELDKQPRVLVAVKPLYPYSLQQSKTSGHAVVQFVIGPDGRVSRARVTGSSHREFEQPAIDAVTRSKWQAGQKNGKNVPTLVSLEVNFRP